MIFFGKKKEVKERTLHSFLYVELKNSSYILLHCPTQQAAIALWLGFWKWFFLRESPSYGLNYKNGTYIIKRDNVNIVNIYTKMWREGDK